MVQPGNGGGFVARPPVRLGELVILELAHYPAQRKRGGAQNKS